MKVFLSRVGHKQCLTSNLTYIVCRTNVSRSAQDEVLTALSGLGFAVNTLEPDLEREEREQARLDRTVSVLVAFDPRLRAATKEALCLLGSVSAMDLDLASAGSKDCASLHSVLPKLRALVQRTFEEALATCKTLWPHEIDGVIAVPAEESAAAGPWYLTPSGSSLGTLERLTKLKDYLATIQTRELFANDHGLLALLGNGAPGRISVRRAAGLLESCASRSPSDAAHLTQLAMLLDARQGAPAADEWQAKALRGLASEAWLSWLSGAAQGALEQRQAARMHGAELMRLTGGILQCSSVPLSDWEARVAELSESTSALLQAWPAVLAAKRPEPERAALAAVLAATLGAHVGTLPTEVRPATAAIVDDLAQGRELAAESAEPALEQAIAMSSHNGLLRVWTPCLQPVLHSLLTKASEAKELGRCWVLLGLARLHLFVPPATGDPASEARWQHEHSVVLHQDVIQPQLHALVELSRLPGTMVGTDCMLQLLIEGDFVN